MLLKQRIIFFSPSKEGQPVSKEDAWLNDVRSQPALSSSPEGQPGVLPPPEPEKEVPVSQLYDSIGPGHRLWPLVLWLSERIWQELFQTPGASAVSGTLTTHVHKRAVDILLEEPRLAQQVHDIAEAKLLLQSIENEVLNYGPLEALMRDESVSEIMVAGPCFACVERNGVMEDVPCCFADDQHILRIIENMLRRAGRHIQPDWPIVDARLPDGSLVNIVMPPSAVNGPTITIRKGSKKPFTIDDLVQMETLSRDMAEFLRACIEVRLNIVICGGIDSGRTTLLNALSAYIPPHERIATIEEIAELRLSQKHVVSLVSQPASSGSAGGISMRDLVRNALRIGSERILLGECRGNEAVEMISAMNNGHNGSLLILYAHDLRHCLTHLETMYQAGGTTLPLAMIRAQIATALDVIIHVSHLRDGSRKILNIAEVQYLENDSIKLQSIFHFNDAGFQATSGNLNRSFEPGGFLPSFLPKFEDRNIHLPAAMFQPRIARR